jgi:ribosome maturation factor RimP
MAHRRSRGSGSPAVSGRAESSGRAGDPTTSADRTTSASRPSGTRSAKRASGDVAPVRARLHQIIEPVVASGGYDLEDLRLSRVGRRYLLRLTVDGDAGVNLDAVARLSTAVSAALDEAERRDGELLAGEYELEVSSPGVDRPLTLPRHWGRNVGRLVKVRVGQRQLTGRVETADDGGVTLKLDAGSEHFPYATMGPGRVQLEFARAAAVPDDELAEIDANTADADDIDADDIDADDADLQRVPEGQR